MRNELIDLRATAAMRAEDLRIARKHEAEARARIPADPDGVRVAARWSEFCADAEAEARQMVAAAEAGRL